MNKKDVLIVIDMQVDFTTGALKNRKAREIIYGIVNYIDNMKDGILIVTQDTHNENYLNTMEGKKLPVPHCIWGTQGHEVVPEIKAAVARAQSRGIHVAYINKPTFGFLGWKNVLPNEEEIKSIKLCGTCTDICDISNGIILKATYPETEIELLEYLCAGVTPELHNAAVMVMESCQITIIKE